MYAIEQDILHVPARDCIKNLDALTLDASGQF